MRPPTNDELVIEVIPDQRMVSGIVGVGQQLVSRAEVLATLAELPPFRASDLPALADPRRDHRVIVRESGDISNAHSDERKRTASTASASRK